METKKICGALIVATLMLTGCKPKSEEHMTISVDMGKNNSSYMKLNYEGPVWAFKDNIKPIIDGAVWVESGAKKVDVKTDVSKPKEDVK
jgi:hypothetical protein